MTEEKKSIWEVTATFLEEGREFEVPILSEDFLRSAVIAEEHAKWILTTVKNLEEEIRWLEVGSVGHKATIEAWINVAHARKDLLEELRKVVDDYCPQIPPTSNFLVRFYAVAGEPPTWIADDVEEFLSKHRTS